MQSTLKFCVGERCILFADREYSIQCGLRFVLGGNYLSVLARLSAACAFNLRWFVNCKNFRF